MTSGWASPSQPSKTVIKVSEISLHGVSKELSFKALEKRRPPRPRPFLYWTTFNQSGQKKHLLENEALKAGRGETQAVDRKHDALEPQVKYSGKMCSEVGTMERLFMN